MRLLLASLLVLAIAFAPAARAAPPTAKSKAPAGKKAPAAEKPFTDDEYSPDGLRFKTEPHKAQHHTVHGAFVKKPPIKHQPFAPSHFRKLPVKDGLVTLPNGNKVRPADFHAGVNHAERSLNTVGHSLRQPGARVKLGHHDAALSKLKVHQAQLARQHKPNKTWKKASLQQSAKRRGEIVTVRQQRAKAPPPKGKPASVRSKPKSAKAAVAVPTPAADPDVPPPGPPSPELLAAMKKAVDSAPVNPVTSANTLKSWDIRAGDPAHFSAYLTGKATTQGDKDSATLHADAEAGGSAFGKAHELLKINADFTASRLEEHTARIDVSVAGNTVFTLDKHAKELWTKGERVERTVDVSATIPIFSIGIIGVNAKIGIQGTAGIDYGVAVGPGVVSGHVTPFVHTGVYVQASVNVLIAEAGVIGKLTLINDDLELTGSVALVPNRNAQGDLNWGVFSKMQLQNNMEMLNGDVSAFVKLYFPCWTSILPSICNKQFDVHLFGWNGIKTSGEIFALQDFKPLDVPVDPTGL